MSFLEACKNALCCRTCCASPYDNILPPETPPESEPDDFSDTEQPDPPLPAGWDRQRHKRFNAYYYIFIEGGLSTWVDPRKSAETRAPIPPELAPYYQ